MDQVNMAVDGGDISEDDEANGDVESFVSESTLNDQHLDSDEEITEDDDLIGDDEDSVRTIASKNKKRVTFHNDDKLVSIKEIPPRSGSPLSEELEPCNPHRLAESVALMGLATYRNKNETDKSASSSRNMHVGQQFAAPSNSFNIISKVISREVNRSMRSKNEKYVSTCKYTGKEKKAATVKNIVANDIEDKLRVGTVDKKSRSTARRQGNSKKSAEKCGHTKQGKLTYSPNTKSSRVRRSLETPSPNSGLIRSCSGASISTSLKLAQLRENQTKDSNKKRTQLINLDTRNLTSGQPRMDATTEITPTSAGTNRISHTSPYTRAVSAGGMRSHLVTSLDELPPPFQRDMFSRAFKTDVSRGSQGPGVSAVQTKRLYAWQMANGISLHNPQLETPCISPMWDNNRTNASSIDSVVKLK